MTKKKLFLHEKRIENFETERENFHSFSSVATFTFVECGGVFQWMENFSKWVYILQAHFTNATQHLQNIFFNETFINTHPLLWNYTIFFFAGSPFKWLKLRSKNCVFVYMYVKIEQSSLPNGHTATTRKNEKKTHTKFYCFENNQSTMRFRFLANMSFSHSFRWFSLNKQHTKRI